MPPSTAARRSLPARPAAALLAAALACLLAFAVPAGARAERGVPVGIYNVNNQVMNSGEYVYAIRFVLDEDTTLARFISGFNLEGADGIGGREGYADGGGGVIRARLVALDGAGEPDLSRVLAEETVPALQRYQESKQAYGAPGRTQLLHFNLGGVQVEGGVPYAMTYQNVDPSPARNWFSENSPTVKESVAGPNGANTLDADAPGAIAGLDPREAVAWSTDGGDSWVWGRRVGEGPTPGAYAGSATSDDGTRLPWYGWQTSPEAPAQSNQPYYAYRESGSYTLRVRSAPSSATLTEAGGYAPGGASAGVITVRNLDTGQSGSTAPLGSGLVRGRLDNPVPVAAGQAYEISNSGTVMKAEADSFIRSTFAVGSGRWPYETLGHEADMAQVFATADPSAQVVQPPPEGAAPPRTRGTGSRSEVVVKRATLSLPEAREPSGGEPARTRLRGKRRALLRFRAKVRGPMARRGAAVIVQIRLQRKWRRVGFTRVRGRGLIRFRKRTRLDSIVGKPRARALVRGVGRSRPVRVTVRR